MPVRPPVEKLPLAVRKSVRDDFEAKKSGVEEELSSIFGVPWTVEADPLAIFAYAESAWAKESLGKCFMDYFDGAVRRLQERKADDLAEINKFASEHILALAADENDKFYGCGCEFADGKLRIIFAPDALGSNSNTALQADKLDKALNEAPAPAGESGDVLSFNAKKDVRESFDAKIGGVQEEAATILKNPDIKLIANIEENYAKLKAESEVKDTGMIKHWEGSIGSACLDYFVSFNKALVRQSFDSDDMMQEGFAEAVPNGEVVLRIVDGPLESACNCVIEDGVLYLQTTAPRWWANSGDVANKLSDLL